MRIVIDEDIPNELTPLFRGPGLVVDQIKPLIPRAVAAFPTARKHAVTTIGVAKTAQRKPPLSTPKRGGGSKPS